MLGLQTLTSAVVEVQLFSKTGSCAFILFCSPPNPRLSVPLSSAAATERLSADLAPDVTSSHLITRYVPRVSLLRAISTRMTFDPARKGEIFPRDRRHVSIPKLGLGGLCSKMRLCRNSLKIPLLCLGLYSPILLPQFLFMLALCSLTHSAPECTISHSHACHMMVLDGC